MKAYKIDLSMYPGKVREAVSEAVQKHGSMIGYRNNHPPMDAPWIFLDDEDGISWMPHDDGQFKNESITAEAFLSLESAEPEFKPFDKVLVRGDGERWRACLFSNITEAGVYCASGMYWKYCIPYEGNEHLLGTTNKE